MIDWTEVFLWTINIISMGILVFTVVYWWRRNKRHKINLMMIRMGRMSPVEFMIRKGRRQKWKSLGLEPHLGYIIGSEMTFEEEMDLLQLEVKKIEDSM